MPRACGARDWFYETRSERWKGLISALRSSAFNALCASVGLASVIHSYKLLATTTNSYSQLD